MNTHPPGHVLFEKYRIERTLDVGGQSVVYQARQLGIGREVALKIVRTDQSPKVMDTLIKRFAREAKLLGQLQNPHTITLHDFGTAPDGSLYMVCEYIPGRDLKQVMLEDGAMSPARVVHILKQMMHPLKEAHAKGILHRDIKPANIMLSEFDGEQDFVKVLDFGIAKIMEETTKLTGINSVVGTPRYIAPEAIRRLELTPSYDLYSAGVIAYNLLTARHPLENLAIKDLLLEIANGPDHTLPDDLDISEGLREIIHKMLRKDRRVRYQSAREVIDALDALETTTLSEHVSAPRLTVASSMDSPQEKPTTLPLHKVAPKAQIFKRSKEKPAVTAPKEARPEASEPVDDAPTQHRDADVVPQRPAIKPKTPSYERTVPSGVGSSPKVMMGHSATKTSSHTAAHQPETSTIVIDSDLPTERKKAAQSTIGTLASIAPAMNKSVRQAAKSTTVTIGAINASQYGHLMAKQHAPPAQTSRRLMMVAGLVVFLIFLLAVIILVMAIMHLSQRM